MTQWATFTGITGVVLVLLLALSYLTQTAFADGESSPERGPSAVDGASSSDDFSSDDFSSDDDRVSPSDSTAGTDLSGETDSSAAVGSSATTDSSDTTETPDSNAGTGVESGRGDEAAAGTDLEGGAENVTAERTPSDPPEPASPAEVSHRPQKGQGVDPESLSTGELLANVALSQGLFALVLIGAVIYTGIPADALGIEFSWAALEYGLLWGTVFGLALYVANEVGAAGATRFGFDHDEGLRELLAPDSLRGWLVLLGLVLPTIAVFEELLFRAALIGAIAAGFGVNPWLLAVVSSVAFAVGHGMQGSVGIVVTGVLGFVLAAIFIWTGSFLAVVVAHYIVNALEFVVHEGLGFDWATTLES